MMGHRTLNGTYPSILVLLIAITVSLLSCSEKKGFKITGDVNGGKEITLRLVMYGTDGISTDAVATTSGHFEYKNNLPESGKPVFIEIYSNDYKLLGLLSVSDGSDVKITVDPENFAKFRLNYGDSVDPDDFGKTLNEWLESVTTVNNETIEKFVRSNTKSSVAYALLSTLYDSSENPGTAYNLLSLIQPDAKPGYYDNGFALLNSGFAKNPETLESFEMLCSADSFFYVEPTAYKGAFVAFTMPDELRKDSVVPVLHELGKDAGKKHILVLEQSLSGDTITWHKAVSGDLVRLKQEQAKDNSSGQSETPKIKEINWISVWTGIGPGAPYANRFNITALPYFVVADSTARIRYTGTSISAATDTLKNISGF